MGGNESGDRERIEWVTFRVRESNRGHHVRRDDDRDIYDDGLPQIWEYFRGKDSARNAYIYASKKAARLCADGRLAVVIPMGARRSDLDLPAERERREQKEGR